MHNHIGKLNSYDAFGHLEICPLSFFPMTVTPFPDFTRLLSASSFWRLTPSTLECASTPLFSCSRVLRCFLRLLLSARFSAGVISLRDRGALEDGAETSSGASIVEAVCDVGSANSRDAAATLPTLTTLAFGRDCEWSQGFVVENVID